MFQESFKKFYAYLVASVMLGLGATAVFLNDGTPTAYAISEQAVRATGFDWPIFFLGILVGAIVVASAFFIIQHEQKML